VIRPKQNIIAPFAAGRFLPHGHIEHWMEGNVLFFEAAGPFNKETVDALIRGRAQWLPAYQLDGPFANLALFRDSVLVTPDAFEAFRSYVSGYTSSGTAFVIPSSVEGASTMGPHFERLFASLAHPFRIFGDRDSAEHWIRAALLDSGSARHAGDTP
jgi:hypothetical protein